MGDTEVTAFDYIQNLLTAMPLRNPLGGLRSVRIYGSEFLKYGVSKRRFNIYYIFLCICWEDIQSVSLLIKNSFFPQSFI